MSRLGKTGRRALASAVATFMMLAVAVAVPTSAGAAGGENAQGSSPVVAGGEDGIIKSEVIREVLEDGRKVRATVTPTGFEVVDGQLVADVVVNAVSTGEGGREVATQTIEDVEVMEINARGLSSGGPGMAGMSSHGCDILNLVLGPLDLDILGLVVQLDTVDLDIIAEPGAGNLLGNLLCQVAGLLDPGSGLGGLLEDVLGQISDLLNQILGGLSV